MPAYLTSARKAGTTIRLGVSKLDDPAVYTHCQSRVMADIRALSGPDLRFDGTRALLLDVGAPLPCSALHALIRTALTYHLGKRAES